jgi:hypothetical protein
MGSASKAGSTACHVQKWQKKKSPGERSSFKVSASGVSAGPKTHHAQ